MTDIEVPPAPVAPVRTPMGVARGVLKTMRPRQWVKNVLVFAAPFVGGDLLTPGIVPKLLIAFVAFSLAASGIYDALLEELVPAASSLLGGPRYAQLKPISSCL